MANTVPPEAPSAFMVPMASRLRARWAATALATPTPPTNSVVKPTSVRNCVKRSTLRSSCGDALLRVRTSQPASGNAAWAAFSTAVTARSLLSVGGSRSRYCQSTRLPGCNSPVARGAAPRLGDQQTRPKAEAAGKLARLSGQRRAQLDRDIADGDAVAGFQIEPRQQRRIDRSAERAVLLREQRR